MVATAADTLVPFASAQHLVLDDVSWDFYERVLAEVGNGAVRVAFDAGRIEIMSPLPRHEVLAGLADRLLGVLCLELGIDVIGLVSTTFRHRAKQVGLEPDTCYHIGANAAAGRRLDEAYDASVHLPPDLAIEVDVTSPSVAREPIHAALGVPEIWRVRVGSIVCRRLGNGGGYVDVDRSGAFPLLRPGDLWPWALRLRDENSVTVLREFQAWVRQLS